MALTYHSEKLWKVGEIPTGDLFDDYLSDNGEIYNQQTVKCDIPGTMVTGLVEGPWIAPFDLTILGIYIIVGTAPTGTSLDVDIHSDGVPGTIYTTQANMPSIAAGNTESSLAVPDVTAIDAGDVLTVVVDQIGSTLPGEDLRLVIAFKGA